MHQYTVFGFLLLFCLVFVLSMSLPCNLLYEFKSKQLIFSKIFSLIMLLTTLGVFTMQQITRWKILIFRFAHLGKCPTWTLRSSLSVLANSSRTLWRGIKNWFSPKEIWDFLSCTVPPVGTQQREMTEQDFIILRVFNILPLLLGRATGADSTGLGVSGTEIYHLSAAVDGGDRDYQLFDRGTLYIGHLRYLYASFL